jgi:hypothetical protein
MGDFSRYQKMNFKEWLIKKEAAPEKQAHVFDFDDTIAVTDSPNIVMFFNDGQAAHKSEQEVLQWLNQNSLKSNELLKGPNGKSVEIVPSRGGYAAYVSSSGLAKIQTNYPGKESITGMSEPSPVGPNVLIDFTTAFSVNQNTAVPIKQTIEKIKKANASGADTMVLTARRGEGKGKSIHGKELEPTNKKDIHNFLSKQGAAPSLGIVGTTGGDKGNILYNKVAPEQPEEIHFYDDLPKNINNVARTLGGKIPADLYLYGPGEFAKGQANADRPSIKIPGNKGKTL